MVVLDRNLVSFFSSPLPDRGVRATDSSALVTREEEEGPLVAEERGGGGGLLSRTKREMREEEGGRPRGMDCSLDDGLRGAETS